MIKIIQSTQEWNDFRPQWDEFYESSSATPFQSFAFQYSSWKNLVRNGTLHIIVIIKENDKTNIAIFPTYIDHCGILRFINGRHIDFCSAIIRPEYENDHYLYKELADHIKHNNQIKGFEFDNLKEDNYLSAILCYLCKGSLVTITNHWSYMYIGHSSERDCFLECIPHFYNKDKYRVKRLMMNLSGLSYRKFSIRECPYPSDLVEEIIDHMIQNGIRTEAYFSESFKKVLNDVYDAGLLTLGVSFRDEKPSSCNICLERGNECIDWLAIYKDRRDNTLNLIQMMQDICFSGGGIFNFARGIYDFKIRNFKPVIRNLYKISYRKSNCGKLVLWLGVCIYYLKRVVKSIIRK